MEAYTFQDDGKRCYHVHVNYGAWVSILEVYKGPALITYDFADWQDMAIIAITSILSLKKWSMHSTQAIQF